MSIKKVTKLIGNIGEAARKYSNLDNEFFRKETAKFGVEIQDRLLDGILGEYDVDGHRFKALKPRTIKRKGHSQPLVAKNKNIKKFLESNDLLTTGTLQVKLNPIPVPVEGDYMRAQNEGFKNVPARKWYGIPKAYKEGGTKYNEFLNKLVNAYNDIFNAAIKKG